MKRIKSFKMFEDHVQGELIFQKDGDPIKDKPQHVQLLDALQEFADKTKFKGKFESKGKYTDYLTDDVKMKAVTTLLNLDENTIMDFYFAFFQEFPVEDNEKFYNKEWFKENDIGLDYKSLSYNLDYNLDYSDILTKKGNQIFQNFKPNQADAFCEENGLIDALDDADNEGVSIYRAFVIKGDRDVYDKLIKSYTGAGYYWSFDEKGAEAHGSDGQGIQYTFFGKVRLQDINWEQTYYKSVYSLRNEMEIEINADAVVKIEKIETRDNKKLPLEEPLYVSA